MNDVKEIFAPVVGYEGLYKISNYGRIYSIQKRKYLRPKSNGRGYLQIELTKEKNHKMHYVHRLVAEAFIENPDNLPQVNHKDENKKNNATENLEWCSAKHNLSYGTRIKRIANKNKKPILQIGPDGNIIRRFDGLADAERCGYNHSNVSNCCSGKLKLAYGYKWRFANAEIEV